MAEAKQAQEPSMEEILASIRRIISDEDSPAEPEPKATPEPAPEPDSEMAAAEADVEMNQDDLDALFDSPAPDGDEEEDESSLEEEPVEPDPEPEPEPEPEFAEARIVEGIDPDEADISFAEEGLDEDDDEGPPLDLGPEYEVAEPEPSPQVDRGPQPRFESSEGLAEALLSPATDAMVSSAFGSLAHTILSKNARTLEDLVQDMLRPLLKSWLDDNLPTIVERLVRQEIERVTRNGGKQ